MVLALFVTALFAIYVSASALATNRASTPGVTTNLVGKALFDEIDLNAHTIPADLWQARLKTEGLSDVYVVDNKIPAHGNTGWHSHPGPSLILVVAGTITNYHGDDPSCTPHVYTAGSGFIDAGGADVHILRNETDAPAETVAVQLLPKGSARKVDMPDPGNCP
jgi:quercetin dioxygenase-like cupin family protein